MEIKLTPSLTLTSDSKNFILSREVVNKKSGKIEPRPIGFYSTLPLAVSGFLKHKMLESNATSLTELVSEHRGLVAYVRGLLNEGDNTKF